MPDSRNEAIDKILSESVNKERKWLLSIKAPVNLLPNDIAEAVFLRYLFSRLPRGQSRLIIETMLENRKVDDHLKKMAERWQADDEKND
jgi:hypothetical protein